VLPDPKDKVMKDLAKLLKLDEEEEEDTTVDP